MPPKPPRSLSIRTLLFGLVGTMGALVAFLALDDLRHAWGKVEGARTVSALAGIDSHLLNLLQTFRSERATRRRASRLAASSFRRCAP